MRLKVFFIAVLIQLLCVAVFASPALAQHGSHTSPSIATQEMYIRNTANIKMYYSVAIEDGPYKEWSVGAKQSVSHYCDECSASYFYIRIATNGCQDAIYKIYPGERNKISWNSRTNCWDFFKDN